MRRRNRSAPGPRKQSTELEKERRHRSANKGTKEELRLEKYGEVQCRAFSAGLGVQIVFQM